MTQAPRSVTVLGSTGSVGTQTVELLAAAPERFQVRALVAGRNAGLLAEQAVALRAERAVIADPASYAALRAGAGRHRHRDRRRPGGRGRGGGAAGRLDHGRDHRRRRPAATLAAIRRGAVVALANKEALVCAGEVMLRAVRDAGATLLPVDSEHNAIFQALEDGNRDAVEKIILTASGGPFRTASSTRWPTPRRRWRAHPVWSMGAKISIDFGHADEQGPGADRGGTAVLRWTSRRSTCWCIRSRSSTAWCSTATAACWRSSARPTCASRSRTRWPGRSA